MNCPNCHQLVEPGAAFCGNCGQPLQPPSGPVASSPTAALPTAVQTTPVSPIPHTLSNIPQANNPVSTPDLNTTPAPAGPAAMPAYAHTTPAQHAGETKALLSVIFGVLGIIGGLFIAILGLALGIAGIVMGTMSRHSKKTVSTVGIVVSSLAVVVGLAVWAYVIVHDPKLHPKTSSHQLPGTSVAATTLSTPCYSTGFADKLNVSNAQDSCDMAAFNGESMDTSSELYKVYANKTGLTSEAGFTAMAKAAIEKDVQTTLPGFTIDSEAAGRFSGSAAYIVEASSSEKNIAVVEAAVYHPVSTGDNVFIMVHATSGSTTNLDNLEAQWEWK